MEEKYFCISQDIDDLCDNVRLEELNLEESGGTNLVGNIFSTNHEHVYIKNNGKTYINLNVVFTKFFDDVNFFKSVIEKLENDDHIKNNNGIYIDKFSAIFLMLHATKNNDKLFTFFSKILDKVNDGKEMY